MRSPKPIEERKARGETLEIFHQVRQSLRISGVPHCFRLWAAFPIFLREMWTRIRPNVETRNFEAAADELRALAVHYAQAFPSIHSFEEAQLGPSQRFWVQRSLELYHYIDAKILLLICAVRLAIDRAMLTRPEGEAQPIERPERILRGVPTRMVAMEMIPDGEFNPAIEDLFTDLRRSQHLRTIYPEYRTLALWPGYLERAWNGLKPLVDLVEYRDALKSLRRHARQLALTLPFRIDFDLANLGEQVEALVDSTARLERQAPGLLLNVALLTCDAFVNVDVSRSPFPVAQQPQETP
jgi:hypothetical protein